MIAAITAISAERSTSEAIITLRRPIASEISPPTNCAAELTSMEPERNTPTQAIGTPRCELR